MNNSKDSLPMGINSPWAIAQKAVEGLDVQTKAELATQFKDLTFEMLTRNVSPREEQTWNVNVALPYTLCKDIFDKAHFMPSDFVKNLMFSNYTLSDEEQTLFDRICDFGKAHGLARIMSKIFSDAESGMERSQSKYLEVMIELQKTTTQSPIIRIGIHEEAAAELELFDGEVITNTERASNVVAIARSGDKK